MNSPILTRLPVADWSNRKFRLRVFNTRSQMHRDMVRITGQRPARTSAAITTQYNRGTKTLGVMWLNRSDLARDYGAASVAHEAVHLGMRAMDRMIGTSEVFTSISAPRHVEEALANVVDGIFERVMTTLRRHKVKLGLPV